uniref:Uncharacterized protein n=1 Tax=Clastoptera arizonana TaxID=38151 RepID=A0A1B6CA61_9HEMI
MFNDIGVVLLVGLVVVNGSVLLNKTSHGQNIKPSAKELLEIFQNEIMKTSKQFSKFSGERNKLQNEINLFKLKDFQCSEAYFNNELDTLKLFLQNDYCRNFTVTLKAFGGALRNSSTFFENLLDSAEEVYNDLLDCQSASGFGKITCLFNLYSKAIQFISEYKDTAVEHLNELKSYVALLIADFYGCLGWKPQALSFKISQLKSKIDLCAKSISMTNK